eukprot:1740123-Lingulodinium_polyedra.AAC.1
MRLNRRPSYRIRASSRHRLPRGARLGTWRTGPLSAACDDQLSQLPEYRARLRPGSHCADPS